MSEAEKLQIDKEVDELKKWWESDAPDSNIAESLKIFIAKSNNLRRRYNEQLSA
jgi:hypothetical protein